MTMTKAPNRLKIDKETVRSIRVTTSLRTGGSVSGNACQPFTSVSVGVACAANNLTKVAVNGCTSIAKAGG